MSYLDKNVESRYDYLVELKKKEGKLNKEYFTDTLLWELFVIEGISDKKIAELDAEEARQKQDQEKLKKAQEEPTSPEIKVPDLTMVSNDVNKKLEDMM